MSNEEFIGRHSYTIEGQLLHFKNHGATDLAETRAVTQLFKEQLARHGRLLLLLDLRRASVGPPDARRYMGEWLRSLGSPNPIIAATYGGNFLVNTFLLLMGNGARLLNHSLPRLKSFTSEAAARDWLAAEHSRDSQGWT